MPCFVSALWGAVPILFSMHLSLSIFVTHDQDEAIEVADEIIITNAGQIEQKGTPVEVYRNPETAFTASFFGQPSVLENADDFHTFTQAEGADKIIVRPEFVKISKLDEQENQPQ